MMIDLNFFLFFYLLSFIYSKLIKNKNEKIKNEKNNHYFQKKLQ